jgi:hypothetical protein
MKVTTNKDNGHTHQGVGEPAAATAFTVFSSPNAVPNMHIKSSIMIMNMEILFEVRDTVDYLLRRLIIITSEQLNRNNRMI